MSYLGVRPQFRYQLGTAVLFTVLGIVVLALGLSRCQTSFFAMTVCSVTPIVASIIYHQRLMCGWSLAQWNLDEKIDWFSESLLLVVTVVGIGLFEKFQREAQMQSTIVHDYKSDRTAVTQVLIGSVLLGVGLGLFKKLANSKLMVGPRFLTTFVFFTNLALLLIGPWFKYTYVAHQMRQAP